MEFKAWKGDTNGNLVFRATARNFNPECAKAGRIAIAEVTSNAPPSSPYWIASLPCNSLQPGYLLLVF